MEIGSSVWIKDSKEVWICGKIENFYINSVKILLENSKLIKIDINTSEKEDIKLYNEGDGELDNLILLPHLHEPAILHAIHSRYKKDIIYTFIGDILLSVNPFKNLNLYSRKTIQEYKTSHETSHDINNIKLPHVYSIAQKAYSNLIEKEISQSILVSGESGAGKTETTKIVMRYLASISKNHLIDQVEDSDIPSIENKVLQSSPILEAFGNAKTIRNENSSRFGKFIEIQFNSKKQLVGARLRTYLLEKVRLISRSSGERSFHIFYELCSGASKEERKRWKLLDNMKDYSYLNESHCYKRKESNINDEESFHKTRRAMTIMGITETEQEVLLSATSAILLLGNICFQSSGNQNDVAHVAIDSINSLHSIADLLKVSSDALKCVLIQRTIQAGGDSVTMEMNIKQAIAARNALAMACYEGIFQWLVNKINSTIRVSDKDSLMVGLLDIFGFEDMKNNSFEQLCINFANETLQQQFNQFVFRLEQETYIKEDISWSFVEFPNNDDCIELFEGKPFGLFSLLDQECLLPNGSFNSLASKYYQEFGKQNHKRFSAAPLQRRQCHFVIDHFAGKICYSLEGILEKNKDSLFEEAVDLLEGSSSKIIQELGKRNQSQNLKNTRLQKRLSAIGSVSVATQFRLQLSEMIERVEETTPHYIRCMKPNDKNLPNNFDRVRMVEQLRCGGVLEVIKVARAGYSIRLDHQSFINKYMPLVNKICEVNHKLIINMNIRSQTTYLVLQLLLSIEDNEERKEIFNISCVTLLKSGNANKEIKDLLILSGIQLGTTRVFFRKNTFELIEHWRWKKRNHSAITIQKIARGFQVKQLFKHFLLSIKKIQSFYRYYSMKKRILRCKMEKAAVVIQYIYRGFKCKYIYQNKRKSIILLQSLQRRRIAQKKTIKLIHISKATKIQSIYRCFRLRKKFLQYTKFILSIQCFFRVYQAKKILIQRREEAKNVEILQQKNKLLLEEVKILKEKLQINKKDSNEDKLLGSESIDLKHVSITPLEHIQVAYDQIRVLQEKLIETQIKYETIRTQSPLSCPYSDFGKETINDFRDSTSSLNSSRNRNTFRDEFSFEQGEIRFGSMYSEKQLGISRFNKDPQCKTCGCKFNFFCRRHHCRECGESFCNEHSTRRLALPHQGYNEKVRVCDECFVEYSLDIHESPRLYSSQNYQVYEL